MFVDEKCFVNRLIEWNFPLVNDCRGSDDEKSKTKVCYKFRFAQNSLQIRIKLVHNLLDFLASEVAYSIVYKLESF